MPDIDRAGIFRGEIIEYGLTERESGAVAVTIKARIDEIWNGEAWEDWREYGMEAIGDMYVVKKDGSVNSSQVEALMKAARWDGRMASITENAWEPIPCQFTINPNEYNGNTTYRIAWVNEYDRTPGAVGNVDTTKAKALDAKYGGQIRALTGNVSRNQEKPKGSKPPAPPRTTVGAARRNDDDVPFDVPQS